MNGTEVTLLDGSPLPPGISPQKAAYIISHLNEVYGPIVFGGVTDGILLGVLLHQFATWLGSRRHETRRTNYLVYYLVLVSVAHSAYTLAFLMLTFASNFGNILPYFNFKWASAFYLFEGLAMPPVEAFFAYRAWRLWGRPRSFLILFPVMCGGLFVLCILLQAYALQGYTTKDFRIVLYCWVVVLLVLEVLVSSLIVTAILKGSNTGFRKTDKLMKKIAIVAVQAQILPLLAALAFAIRKLALPQNPSGWAFIGMPKIWPIALLSVLNSKYKIRNEIEKERDRREQTFDLGLTTKTETAETTATMDVTTFIRAEQVEAPIITHSRIPAPPALYFAPDEIPEEDVTEEHLVGVVGQLQYVEEDIGMRRRSSLRLHEDDQERRKSIHRKSIV